MGALVNKCPKCQNTVADGKLGSIATTLFRQAECHCRSGKLAKSKTRTKLQTVLRVSDQSYVGKVIDDRFEILELVGSGGMGSVYRALERSTNTEYALKFIAPELLGQQHLARRLLHEANAAKNLTHAHIVPVYDVGNISGDSPYLIMGFVTGESLESVLNSEGVLTGERAINIFIQIAEALVHAHEKGIVHRDLKPSNVLLTKHEHVDDFVKLVDFGIAKIADSFNADKTKLTQTGELIGTPLYMSPEQCHGDELDARSDLYSLGCVMYETISGSPPFDGENAVRVLLKQISDEPAPLPKMFGISADLKEVIMRCLEKDSNDRYQSATALLRDLENVRDGKRISQSKRKWNKRQVRKIAIPVGALALGALLAGLFTQVNNHSQTSVTAPQAFIAAPSQSRPEVYNGRSLQELTDEIERSPNDPDLFFDRGMLHSFRDERTNAIDDFSQAISLKPDFFGAYIERSFLYVMVANYEKAMADANKALSIEPASGEALAARGLVFASTERYKHAIDDFKQAAATDGGAEAYSNLGRQYMKLARYKEAEEAFANGRRNSSYIKSLLGLVAVFKQELPAARDLFLNSATARDTTPFDWGERAYYYVAAGDLPQSERAIAQMKALETFPARSFRLAGEVYRTAGLEDKAIQEFSASTSLEEYPPGYRERAVTYIQIGQLHAAKTDLERSLKLNPYSSITLSYLALVESRLGMRAEANDHINKAFAGTNVQPPIVYANKAAVELGMGDAKAALKTADQALLQDPWLKEGYQIRAQIYDSLKDARNADADRAKASSLLSHLDL